MNHYPHLIAGEAYLLAVDHAPYGDTRYVLRYTIGDLNEVFTTDELALLSRGETLVRGSSELRDMVQAAS